MSNTIIPRLSWWQRLTAEFTRSPVSVVLNITAMLVLVLIAIPIVQWALIDAVWTGDSGDSCPPGSGACWAFIGSKLRLILFGRFPYDDQWRSLVGTVILVALVVISLNPIFWRKWLLPAWVAGLLSYGILMWGGVFGLSYVESSLWGGLPLTILLTVFGVAFGLVISVPLALGRQSKLPVFRLFSIVFVEAVRGVPLISVLFMASVLLPLILPDGFTPDGLGRVLIGLTLFLAAYMAEVLRGGLQAIPKGQYEACRSLGIAYWPMMLKVILPQAFETVLPAMVNLLSLIHI